MTGWECTAVHANEIGSVVDVTVLGVAIKAVQVCQLPPPLFVFCGGVPADCG